MGGEDGGALGFLTGVEDGGGDVFDFGLGEFLGDGLAVGAGGDDLDFFGPAVFVYFEDLGGDPLVFVFSFEGGDFHGLTTPIGLCIYA